MTNTEKAISRILSALATAEQNTMEDAATNAALQRVQFEEVLLYLFLDYPSRGFLFTLPEQSRVPPWKVPSHRILEMDEPMLSARLIAWVKTGVPPS